MKVAAEILGLSIPGPLTFLGVGRACLRRCAENHLTGWPSGAKEVDSEAWTTEMGIPQAQEVREREPDLSRSGEREPDLSRSLQIHSQCRDPRAGASVVHFTQERRQGLEGEGED